MRNYWLSRAFRTGRKVRYKGLDAQLQGKMGQIMAVWGEWIDVEFEMINYKYVQKRVVSIERDSLELI